MLSLPSKSLRLTGLVSSVDGEGRTEPVEEEVNGSSSFFSSSVSDKEVLILLLCPPNNSVMASAAMMAMRSFWSTVETAAAAVS